MDVVMVVMGLLALLGLVAVAGGVESRDGFEQSGAGRSEDR
jgi:hypothetical protein